MSHMDRFKNTPIPSYMEMLPRDRRGFPIPYIVFRDKNGDPHFTINDQRRVTHAKNQGLCSICGKTFARFRDGQGRVNPNPRDAGMWFVGGPLSALHPRGAYVDPPSHRECAAYALTVCPFLAAPVYSTRIEDRTVKKGAMAEESVILVDPTMLPDRPDVFVAVWATGWREAGAYMKPIGVRAMQAWRHGARLTAGEEEMEFSKWHAEITASME